jgi:hypothetical protein
LAVRILGYDHGMPKIPAVLRHSTSNEASLRMHLRRTSCTPHEAHVVAPLLIDYCVENGVPDPYLMSAKDIRELMRTDVIPVPLSEYDEKHKAKRTIAMTNFYGNTAGADAYYAEQRRINLDRMELAYEDAEIDNTVSAEQFDVLTRDIRLLREQVAADEYAADLRFGEATARRAARSPSKAPTSTVRVSRPAPGTGTPRATFSHAQCDHPATPKARGICRKTRAATDLLTKE